jgi:hypothetical protein
MQSVFLNGGMIGATLDYGATDRYVVGTTTGLATITLVGTPTTSATTSISLPTGLQQNDLVVICSVADSTTQSLPTGYTNGQNGASNSTNYRWSYKFMGVTPDTTATNLASSSAHIAFAFRGVDTTTPLDVTSPAIATATSGMPNSPSITTTTDTAMIVAAGFLDDDAVAASVTAPSTYTLINAAQNGATVMAAYKLKSPAGADDPAVFGGSGTDSWVGATFALRPATVDVPIFGNLKNSGIWLLQSVYEDKAV